MKAWQRTRREEIESDQSDEGLFGQWWLAINRDISNAVIRKIDYATARTLILKYEWLGCMPAVCWFQYGIFFDGNLAGCVVYGPEYSENLGVISREQGKPCADWSKYGFEGKMILLSRGACVHWAHPHSASKLIRQSIKMLPEKYKVITCTVDYHAGEIGTIYQACGFHYVGSMRDGNPNVNSRKDDRQGWLVNGKLYGGRSIRQACGSTKWKDIITRFPDAEMVKQTSKGRYFAFRGTKAEQREMLKAIEHLIKPYPKRTESVT